jgi:hypothetical protein
MKTFRTSQFGIAVIKLGWFSAFILSAISLPVRAEIMPPMMTDSEILEVVSGNTTIGTFADRPLNYAVFLMPTGQMIGRISDGTSERIELGRWRVVDNTLCGQWDNLGGGEENCVSYHRVGSNIHAYNADGNLDRIQFFVEGDPLGLQQQSARKARVCFKTGWKT